MEIKVQGHAAYQTQYHIVWIPKKRKRILIDGAKEYLEKVLKTCILDRYPDVYISEQNIQPDHVHILIEIPPKYSVSTVVGYLKGLSSREMRKQFDFIKKMTEMWSVGYFVSTVGINEKVIQRYIRHQEKQDSGQALLVSD